MKFIQKLSEKIAPHFEKSGKYELFFPLFEVIDTFFLTPLTRTSRGPHIRDKIDSKRFMITVVIAMFPAILIGMYNIGYQASLAKGHEPGVMAMHLVRVFDHVTCNYCNIWRRIILGNSFCDCPEA